MYRDVTASIYPAIAYNEEVLWYESQAEGVLACENLAAQENEQAKQILTENQQAKDNEKTTYADSEKKQENVLQTAKVDETGKKKKSIVKNYRILIICVRHFIRWIIRQRSIGIS